MSIKHSRRALIGGSLGALASASCAPLTNLREQNRATLENPEDTTKEKIAINDMLVNVAKIQPGQHVLIMAHLDGLYGGDNIVEFEVLELIAECVKEMDADPQIFLIDRSHEKPFEWEMPPNLVEAVRASDCLIMHSFDYVTEEVLDLRRLGAEVGKPLVRNFATTRALLRSDWVQTPYALVSEIRYQTSKWFRPGDSWTITHENGTHMEGTNVTAAPTPPHYINYPFYHYYRAETQTYRPFPEWVIPPIGHQAIDGVMYSDSMLSYWARFIDIDPFYDEPIKIELENSRIVDISGYQVANKIMDFHRTVLEPRYGEAIWYSRHIHPGVHPNAFLTEQQEPNVLIRRLADHSNSNNFHMHLGDVHATPDVTYWPHVTADLDSSTWTSGDRVLLDKGYNTYLDHPDVIAVAQQYPDRPTLPPKP